VAGAIRFGASVSVSGRYALQGRQVLAGLRAWVEAVTAGGGLKVHGAGARAPVRLVYYDDASSPALAAANAERLLDADAVEVLIGPYASDLTRAVLPVAGRRGRVLWNHGGASDDIHVEAGRAVGILTPVSRYFGGLIELARSLDPDAARVALLHRRGSGFGRMAALGVRAAASDATFVADVVTYSSLASDLPSVMASLERQSPDVVISAGSFDDEVVLARALLGSGLRPKAVGLAAAAMQEFPQALGTYAEGFLGAEPVGAAARLPPRLRARCGRGHRGHPGPRRSARLPGRPGLRRLSDRPALPGGGRRRRRVAVARGLRPGLWDVLRAVPYRSCNGPAGGPRDGPRAVAAGEEARGLAAPRVQGQAPVPEAASSGRRRTRAAFRPNRFGPEPGAHREPASQGSS